MAMPQLTLLALMALATLCSAALLIQFDDATGVLLGFAGALLWGYVALSSYSVVIGVSDTGDPTTVTVTALPIVGVAAAVIVALFAFLRLFSSAGDRAGSSESDIMDSAR